MDAIWLWALLLMVGTAGCGREDSLFSGFSLVVIIVVGFLLVRHFAKKGG